MLGLGARIAVVAPAGRVDQENLAFPLSRLRECGWEYVLGQHIYDEPTETRGHSERLVVKTGRSRFHDRRARRS
jgi:muramoyltetrapeptide carboxypeptidase LdcA involved in peptidoglycan recycling